MDSGAEIGLAEITRRVRDMLVFLGLPEQAQSPLQLSVASSGASLARALVVEPDVLLLAEPFKSRCKIARARSDGNQGNPADARQDDDPGHA
jgi:ABC-type Fe3+/spermidine/putrescine transport system ATPase subunit